MGLATAGATSDRLQRIPLRWWLAPRVGHYGGSRGPVRIEEG